MNATLLQNAVKKHNAGKHFDAQKICKRILKANPNDAEALNLIAVSYLNTGQNQKALSAMEKAYALNPANPNFQGNLAAIITVNIKDLAEKINARNNDYEIATEFSRLLKLVNFNAPNDDTPIVKQAIFNALQNEELDNVPLANAYVSILMHNKTFGDIYELSLLKNFKKQTEELAKIDLTALLNDPYLLLGLKTYPYFNAHLERVFTLIRKYYLLNNPGSITEIQPFLSAFAEQSDLNEYVFFIEDEEKKALEKLISELKISKDKKFDAITISHLLLIGSYMSLDQLEHSEQISKNTHLSDNQYLSSAINIQIDKTAHRRELIKSIPTINKIENETSRKVQDQYEENPYPRWQRPQKVSLSNDHIRLGKELEILIAGCGTGKEAIELAHMYPKANVTAIDLSMASLSYSKQKALESDTNNINFVQLDILKVDQLGKQFDLISSSGVLHHMEDPLAGWKALVSVLKPDGAMKVGLYSELARKSVVECRQLIEKTDLKPVPDDIRKLRRDILDMSDDNILKYIQTYSDFANMSMLRDLVFHVQEHRYTIPQIQSEFEELGLSPLSLTSKSSNIMEQYKATYPDDPECNNLDHWNQFEENNPESFKLMYCLLCNPKGQPKPNWLFINW